MGCNRKSNFTIRFRFKVHGDWVREPERWYFSYKYQGSFIVSVSFHKVENELFVKYKLLFLFNSAGLPVAIKGDGVIHDSLKNGHYNVRYAFGVPFQGTILSILDTDYKEYAVVYSCTNSLLPRLLHSEHIWVLTRNGVLTNPSRQNIYTKLDQLKINRNNLILSDRNGCPAISTNTREEEIINANIRSNLTSIESNVAMNNVVGSAREELATEKPN